MADRLGHVLINSRCTSCEVRSASDTGRIGAPYSRSELGQQRKLMLSRLWAARRAAFAACNIASKTDKSLSRT
jgi:hypothetical protein